MDSELALQLETVRRQQLFQIIVVSRKTKRWSQYGAIHLVTTTFGQWLCSGEIMIEKFFEFYTFQNSQIISITNCLHGLMSVYILH